MKCSIAFCKEDVYRKVTFKSLYPKVTEKTTITHYFCCYHAGFIEGIQDLSKNDYVWESIENWNVIP